MSSSLVKESTGDSFLEESSSLMEELTTDCLLPLQQHLNGDQSYMMLLWLYRMSTAARQADILTAPSDTMTSPLVIPVTASLDVSLELSSFLDVSLQSSV